MPNLSVGSPFILGPNEALVHLLITEMQLTCDQYLAMSPKERVAKVASTPYAQHVDRQGLGTGGHANWGFWADQILHNCQAIAQTMSTAPGFDSFLRSHVTGPNITGGAYGHQTYVGKK